MKKIFSLLLIIINVPKRIIKRVKVDNFVAGLIFGAIFSLIVNVVTIQIQEMVQKQRILEALENEIASNMVQANSILKLNPEKSKKKEEYNIYYKPYIYSRDLWSQSSEPLQYTAQLPAKTQMAVSTYYSYLIPYSNSIQEKHKANLDRLYTICVDEFGVPVKGIQDKCNQGYWNVLNAEAYFPAEWVSDKSYELLQLFHPTADRLKNPYLRFLMGSDSMRILSGK